MGSTSLFDLNTALEEWQQTNLKNKGLTPDDQLELFDHFCLTVDELSSMGLSEKESFAIAQIRFGEHEYWAEPIHELNEENYVAKKTLNVFYGIMIYFIIANSIFIIFNIVYVAACSYYQNNYEMGIDVFRFSWKWIYPVTLITVFSIFFFRKTLSRLIQDEKHTTKKVISTSFIFLSLLIFKNLLVIKIKHLLRALSTQYDLYHAYDFSPSRFQYWFPLLVAFCFVFVFLLLKKAKSI